VLELRLFASDSASTRAYVPCRWDKLLLRIELDDWPKAVENRVPEITASTTASSWLAAFAFTT